MDRVMTPGLVPDPPRRAGVARCRRESVVASLSVRMPNRVNRRQVQDIEAQLLESRELALDAPEPSP